LLSLNYTEQEERLTLGIENVKLRSATLEKISEEAGLYVKVTLFESLKVVKAKKTRPITITNLEGEFKECFSILFPIAFIDQVSCIISLCWKTKTSSKLVLGRTSIGPHWRSDDQGFTHWNEMKLCLGDTVSKWHELKD